MPEESDDFDRRLLRTGLRDLVGRETMPTDPVSGVRGRVRRSRRLRTGGVAALAAGAVGAAALLSGPALDLVRDTGSESGYAGTVIQPPPQAGSSGPTATPTIPLPPPWSDEVADVEFPHLYLPKPYVIASGEVDQREWTVVSFTSDGLSAGCLEVPGQAVFDPSACYDHWPQGSRADWHTSWAYAAAKPNNELVKATLVMGAVSVEARTVEIEIEDGRSFTTDAVATPSSDKLRFFATVVPAKGAKVTIVRPYDEDGQPTGRPDLPERGGPCVGEQPKKGDSGREYTCSVVNDGQVLNQETQNQETQNKSRTQR